MSWTGLFNVTKYIPRLPSVIQDGGERGLNLVPSLTPISLALEAPKDPPPPSPPTYQVKRLVYRGYLSLLNILPVGISAPCNPHRLESQLDHGA